MGLLRDPSIDVESRIKWVNFETYAESSLLDDPISPAPSVLVDPTILSLVPGEVICDIVTQVRRWSCEGIVLQEPFWWLPDVPTPTIVVFVVASTGSQRSTRGRRSWSPSYRGRRRCSPWWF
jgi:hypothetical protein